MPTATAARRTSVVTPRFVTVQEILFTENFR